MIFAQFYINHFLTSGLVEKIANLQGRSIAEVTRLAIDIGLEKLSVDEQREQMLAAGQLGVSWVHWMGERTELLSML